MDKLLEKYIKDSIEIQRGTYQAGYQIGYKKGFEAGKRADLEKEMAERDEPKEKSYPEGTYYYKEQIDNNFKKELKLVAEDLGVASIGNAIKKVLSEAEMEKLINNLTK